MSRNPMRTVLPVLAASVAPAACERSPDPAARGPAPSLHASILTLDSHVDIPFEFATPEVAPRTAPLQVNLDSMRIGGLDAAFFIVYVGQGERTDEAYVDARERARVKFAAIRRMTDEIGRASCRGGVWVGVVAVAMRKGRRRGE